MLLSGDTVSIKDIAKGENLSAQYVRVLIQLAYLAPDFIESVFIGKIPATLTLRNLKKGFPSDWEKQRRLLGFRSS